MADKKQNHFAPPDMSKLKSVIIDNRTRIYIPLNMDAEQARERYWANRGVTKPDVVKA
ncbi:MAG: hypothetical protein PF436_10680 [Prolixibacteraceae bacterium]|jgi:hypothetical protein|nr:hypothetical protein [Prolixibacteraceae bacterium]